MATYRIDAGRRGSWPSWPLRLNTSCPVAAGVSRAYVPVGPSYFDLVTGIPYSSTTAALMSGYPGLGAALTFDATNDVYNVGTTKVLTSGVPFTVAWWEVVKTGYPTYCGRIALPVTNSVGGKRLDIIRSDTTYTYLHCSTGLAGCLVNFSATPLASSINVLHHYVIVGLSGPDSNNSANFVAYENGVLLTSSGALSSGPANNTDNLIGTLGGWGAPGALIGPVTVWGNRALSEGEVRMLYSPMTRRDLYWQPGRVVYFDVGAAAAFNAGWARNSNQILSGGYGQ